MQPFFISPTESLLIGLCLGGYLQRKECGLNVYFLDVVESWLQPFVPAFVKTERFSISSDEFPADVVLSVGSTGLQLGTSLSHPDMAYGIGPSGPFCVNFKSDRKSLLDLIGAYLGGHIVRSPVDETHFRLADGYDLAKRWVEVGLRMGDLSETGNLWFMERTGEEDSNAISRRIEELMQFNECDDSFSTGRNFGRIVAICDGFAERLAKLTHADIETSIDGLLLADQIESYSTILRHLTLSPLIRRSTYAERCLADCPLPKLRWLANEGLFNAAQRSALQCINQSRMRLWLAFGELLGFLRDADCAATTEEWTSANPRTFRELFDATGDKVRKAIQDAELTLSKDNKDEDVAARVVEMLANGIEALAKRTWSIPSSRSQQSQNTLMQVLFDKRQSGTESEKRFADIAITLYKRYRNQVVHELEKFECSFTEARFFILGMRTLLELSDRIQAEKSGK